MFRFVICSSGKPQLFSHSLLLISRIVLFLLFILFYFCLFSSVFFPPIF
jgi:hypothetical protein